MTFTFVTSYFEFDSTKTHFYFIQFYKILIMNFPIILFLDHNLEYKLDELNKFSNLTVILIKWEDLPINKKISKIENIIIPNNNNSSKDNCKFLILMNSKVYLLKEAKKHIISDLLVWIDFGCLKITNDLVHFRKNFAKLQEEKKINKILIPGGFECKAYLDNFFLMNCIFWRFLGGIIICPYDLIDKFDEENNKLVFELLDKNIITYEVNIFCNIEFMNENLIHYYKADHNKGMFGFYDIKRIFFDSYNNSVTNDPKLVDSVGHFVNNNKYKCDAFCLNIVNDKHNLIIHDNIYDYMQSLKDMNCNAKLNIDGKKYLEEHNEKILNINLIDYCNELGWFLEYTIGVSSDGNEILLQGND